MTKYRIKKSVSYHPDLGDGSPRVYYRIEWKCLWWWEPLNEVLGCKYAMFNTLEEAEEALKKHDRFSKILESDDKIVKTLKL